MSWIEHRSDNCPDQPRFGGGIIVVALVTGLLWAAAVGIVWFFT